MAISISHKGKAILKNVSLANTFWKRFSGYMLRRKPHEAGILFPTSGAMQTTFMRFNLDIIFLDRDNKIVKILRNVKPWRATKIYAKVSKVLEVPAGCFPLELTEGDFLEIC